MDFAFIVAGLAILVGAGDALVRGAVVLSLKLGMPAVIISATVIAFGTSAPEMFISIKAAIHGATGIALGNVVGSNIANVFLVLGVPALIVPIAGCGQAAHRNTIIMLMATVVFTGFIISGHIPRWGGLVLLAITIFMVLDSIRCGRAHPEEVDDDELEEADPEMPIWKLAILLLVGFIGLPIGAELLIQGAQGIALDFGVSEAVVGLTIIAVGTSLPELATTVAAALRNQADVAIGNVVGSNLFNITAVIGVAALVRPLDVPPELFNRDIWFMLGATAVLAPFIFLCLKISRPIGAAFLAIYAGYIVLAYA
ncbi:calcium/sodium antiporter [Rhodobacteraceae bacterium NNCM2]|nr:calcium/sodium antiporter [Coraliihabitans acroporae]